MTTAPAHGDHVKVWLDGRLIVLPELRGELKTGLFRSICKDLAIDPGDLQEATMIYPARLHPEPEGGYAVSFRDVPSAHTQGETVEEAHRQAESALISALSFYADEAKPCPPASAPKRGEHLVFVPHSIRRSWR